jgi:peptidoglycan/xylan/chitin deacetylase (PgdA/CDA1 family)
MKLIALLFSFLASPTFAAPLEVAITVDDLPRHGEIPNGSTRLQIAEKMLAALKAHHVPEVYGFINAKKEKEVPEEREVLKLWVKAGYPLGNHTFSHPDLIKSSVNEFEEEIKKDEPELKTLSGKFDWHYFRYPFLREGDTIEKREAVREYLKNNHYKIAQVTIDFEDWSWNNPYARCADLHDQKSVAWLKATYLKNSTDQLERAGQLSQALFKKTIKHILLLHIGAFDAEMIDSLLTAYEKAGVKFIPLSEAVSDPVYELDPMIALKSGSEFTYQMMLSRHLKLSDLGMQSYGDLYPEKKLESICRQ